MKDQHTEELVRELDANAVRIRRMVVQMLAHAGSGHPGGSLSAADIIAALYFHHLRVDPKAPGWEERDRFILSKGHAAPALYAALAGRGFFPEEKLWTLRQVNSDLQGHPDANKTPGVDVSTGSLGQGLSVGIGMALGARLQHRRFSVYVMIGDGECDEGQVWEAAAAAVHYRLGSLVAMLDENHLQLDGPCDEIMYKGDLAAKWRAFGWHVIPINGHDMRQILDALHQADDYHAGPAIIIADTVKGKGVSFMESRAEWHGRPITQDESAIAMAELGARDEE